jgi:hypothetical protein
MSTQPGFPVRTGPADLAAVPFDRNFLAIQTDIECHSPKSVTASTRM